MRSEKKLYRARDSLVGGVCKGIAEYFNIDPIIVQILTVVLTLASAGLLVAVYIVLWVIIPPLPQSAGPVDVDPSEVRSETYGEMPYYQVKSEKGAPMPENQASWEPYDPYAGVAHVPPTPPAASPAPAPVPEAAFRPEGVAVARPRKSSSNGALWLGLTLLSIGVIALLGAFVREVSWWQLWPLLIVIVGIGVMVVPGEKGHRMERFVNGLMLLAFGATALAISLDVVSVRSLWGIFNNLWPLLVIMCGFFVLGAATKFPLFVLLGGLTFVAFCVIGILWFSLPGLTDTVTLALPTGQDYVLNLRFWA